MSSTTIKLYNQLVDLGANRAEAEEAVSPILTKDEALATLSTKEDLRKMTMWVAGMLVGQIAINTAILAVMFNLYG